MSDFLAAQTYASEIIVVDDGSSDDTAGAVRAIAATLPIQVRLLRYPMNRGKGHALKVGFGAARGACILFTDTDLSTPMHEAARLLAGLSAGFDVAIGSRKLRGARVAVHQPWHRELMGKAFTSIVRVLIADVSDATCGFKAFRRDAGRAIFARLRIYDWSFDAELLWLADVLGYRINEVPVEWRDAPGTKVRLASAVLSSLLGLVRIRWYALTGAYAQPRPVDVATVEWPALDVPSSPGAAARERA